jgi:hypothetical protein
MAFGSSSNIFQYAMRNLIALPGYQTAAPTGMTSTGFLGDTMKFALYGNSGTPDKTVATATLSSYNGSGSQWVTANEVTGTNYSAGGDTLSSKAWAIDTGSSSVCFTAANPTWTAATITAYGGLLYDASISGGTGFAANEALCFNSFGGSAQTVSGGTFTVAWATPAGAAVTAVFNIAV